MVDLPLWAMPSNTLCLGIRLFLQTRIGVESVYEMAVHEPKQQVFKNKVIGTATDCISSTNLL